MASIWRELRRRNVFRVGLAYLAAAWLLLQVAEMILSNFGAPAWIIQALIFSSALGFPLVLIPAWFYELTPEGLRAESDVEAVEAVKFTGRKIDFAIIGLLVLAVGFLVVDNYVLEEPPASFAAGDYSDSIAALPFANESAAAENAEFFANGIHDEVLTRLANIGSLKVISRTSVEEYRGTSKNLREIGRELGVAAILEGRVQRAGDMVRINVQLINATTDEHLWAEIYNRELTAQNILAIQSDIATSIADALESTLSPQAVARLDAVPTENTRAYDFYLSGREYQGRRGVDEASLSLAVQQFERAVEADPEFALAWTALSRSHSFMYFDGVDRGESRLDSAREAVERAFRLSPNLPEAHLARGYYYYHGLRDYDSALQEWAIAEQGMPGDSQLFEARAYVYRRIGDWDQALVNLERAIDLDPRNVGMLTTLSLSYESLRDYPRVQQIHERILELEPDNRFILLRRPRIRFQRGDFTSVERALEIEAGGVDFGPRRSLWLWLAALHEQDYDAAVRILDEWEDNNEDAYLHGITYYLAGMPDLATPHLEAVRADIETELEDDPDDPRLVAGLGEILGYMGDTEPALDLAHRGLELHRQTADAAAGPQTHVRIIWALVAAGDYQTAVAELELYLSRPGRWSIEGLMIDPGLVPVRDDPRFLALLEKYRQDWD